MNTEAYAQSLISSNPLREPTIRSAIQALHLPVASKGLDIGCGIGLQTLLLAEIVGPDGQVTGLDPVPEFLSRGQKIITEAGLANRISFRKGTAASIPFDNDTFDWSWSADCVGYGPWDPLPLVKEMRRIVKPGGTVALIAWSSEQLLPGYPHLEAQLKTTSAGIAPYEKGQKPEKHFSCALSWFREPGFINCQAQVFAGSVFTPLKPEIRKALVSLFDSRWQGVEKELAKTDLAEFQRLCKPDSADFILNQANYYAFFTYSMFWGIVCDKLL